MKNYKVEITKTYVIDLKSNETNEIIIAMAEDKLDKAMLEGREHYYQSGDTGFEIFDVTDTDDAFDDIN